MLSGLVTRISVVTAIVFAAVSPSAANIVDYELSFNALRGPNGTGSFAYDDTPGAEWMSDIALDFGVGFQGVIYMEHDLTVTGENLYLFLFQIFSDTSPFGPGYHQSAVIDSHEAAAGIWPVVEGDGFHWIEFAKHSTVFHGSTTLFIDGPLYQFHGPAVAPVVPAVTGDPYYGTISLSQAAAVPLPAAFPLLAGALACMSVFASRRRRSRTG